MWTRVRVWVRYTSGQKYDIWGVIYDVRLIEARSVHKALSQWDDKPTNNKENKGLPAIIPVVNIVCLMNGRSVMCVCVSYYVSRKTSNIRRTLVGNQIVDHSDIVGASPVGAAPTTSSFST